MVDHRGATNTVLDINQRFRIGPQDRVLALSRLSFDLSVYDIFGLLAAGGTIVMPSADLAHDAVHWADLISTGKVTVWNTVPALMQLLVDQVGKGEADVLGRSLRLVMLSGDWIPVGLPGQIRRILPNTKLFSLGGATEASIWSILYPIESVDPDWKSIPYGKPMLNQSFHVLNQAQAACPVWVPGHLYIGGIGLAKGYWRDEQKTHASFIQDLESGLRLYRTGDLGRYLPDGNIEFLGREDLQVKVQGYRIELGEIEVRLQEHENIETCVVAVREDHPGEKRLVGYAIVKPGMRLEPADLREFLRAKLPEYMVPSSFVFLERFPLTPNGKVDRKALPAPVRSITQIGSKPSAPRDTLELQLTKLWEKTLGVRPVNLGDNFFDLGGDSLMAVRLFSELRQLTGRTLPLSSLFQAPTVEKLADLLRQQGWSANWSSLVPIQPGGSKPPFYCVHGAGGNVLLFRDLARSLGPEYPFYGLQARGLDGSEKYLRKVEDMAAHYLKEIRELQPQGPYYLGGFCMGGQVAYEMAQNLRNQGEKVALLIMIDTYNFNGIPLQLSFRESVTHSTEKITFHSQNILGLSRREQLDYLRKKLKWAFARELERMRLKVSNLFKTRDVANGSRSSNGFLENINEDATFAYVPRPYTEEITIFKPQRHYTHLRDPQMGWGGAVSGKLSVIDLPVNPGGIFIDPYVQTLAEKLRRLLDEAHAEQTRENQLTSSLA
jgi:thioesterase domain-containing protein/acyl carrier protein